MGFTITKVCGSSNKHQTLGHFDAPKTAPVHFAAKAPTPFIDKISVTVDVPTEAIGMDMAKSHQSYLFECLGLVPANPSKGYQRACRIQIRSIADSKKWPFYEWATCNGAVSKVRIDLNPVDLGRDGLLDLHSSLIGLMPNGWSFFIAHGRISRLDVTVDLPGLQMSRLHFLPNLGVTSTTFARSGKLVGYRLGKPRASHTMIYDRKVKRVDQGKPWVGKEGVRIERRVKSQSLPFSSLPDLPCQFSHVDVVQRDASPPDQGKQYLWDLFLTAAEAKGVAAALMNLPEKRRSLYRKQLKNHMTKAWNTTAIWERWPAMLADLRICELQAWL